MVITFWVSFNGRITEDAKVQTRIL